MWTAICCAVAWHVSFHLCQCLPQTTQPSRQNGVFGLKLCGCRPKELPHVCTQGLSIHGALLAQCALLALIRRCQAGKVRAQTPDTRSPSCVSSGAPRQKCFAFFAFLQEWKHIPLCIPLGNLSTPLYEESIPLWGYE